MYNPTKKELKFMEEFGGADKFLSLIASYDEMYAEEQLEQFNIDCCEYTSDGIVVGLIVGSDYNEEQLYLDIIIDGIRRKLKVAEKWTEGFLYCRDLLRSNPNGWSKEAVETFAFLNHKPFIIDAIESEIIYISPKNWEPIEALIEKILRYELEESDDIQST